jgi:hypothetical protein
MIVLKLLPVIISFLILAAHFLRDEAFFLAFLCLVFPAILFLKSWWAPRLIQIFLLLGTVEWIRTLSLLIAVREQSGQTWQRLAVILGAVALITFLSVFIFQLKAFKNIYNRDLNENRMEMK